MSEDLGPLSVDAVEDSIDRAVTAVRIIYGWTDAAVRDAAHALLLTRNWYPDGGPRDWFYLLETELKSEHRRVPLSLVEAGGLIDEETTDA